MRLFIVLIVVLNINLLQAQYDALEKLWNKDWEAYGDPEGFGDDLVILKDGTKVWGKLESIPDIHYSFASIGFEKAELAVIEFLEDKTASCRYLSRRGERYSGSIEDKPLKFLKKGEKITLVSNILFEYEKKRSKYFPVELQLSSIDLIFLKPARKKPELKHKNFLSIELINGDRFPFHEHSYETRLQTGKKQFSILTRNIVEIECKHGGLQGYIKKEGLDEKLSFSLLLDKSFSLRLAKNNQLLQIPWHEIHKIQADQGLMDFSKVHQQQGPSEMVFVAKGRFYFGKTQAATKDLRSFPVFRKESSVVNRWNVAQILNIYEQSSSVQGPGILLEMPAFYIDKCEVKNLEYAKFIAKTGHRAPPHWPEGQIPIGKEHHPVVNISYHDAKAFATWTGKRLPNEIEWERAAKIATSFDYSYGPYYDRSKANTEGVSTMPVGSFANAAFDQLQYPQALLPRALDLNGNVQEWTSSHFIPFLHEQLKERKISWLLETKQRTKMRVVRGGSYKSSAHTAQNSFRSQMHEDDFNEHTGFRCVKDFFPN